ncbi:MAG: GNAT family N-acetyltransferase [Cardiobacteriaceae bacterium]|nr:GNAT family N-acetyltransferase [Cardiobacteriaceae bacterium]
MLSLQPILMNILLTPWQHEHTSPLNYRLNSVQASFTRTPYEWLLDNGFTATQLPVTILADDVPIGFFILDSGTDKQPYTDNPHALLLRSMSMNPAWQGRGLAKQALAPIKLSALIASRFPEANEIILGVNQRNTPAHRLYLACGFCDTGRTYMGIQELQYVLSLPLP